MHPVAYAALLLDTFEMELKDGERAARALPSVFSASPHEAGRIGGFALAAAMVADFVWSGGTLAGLPAFFAELVASDRADAATDTRSRPGYREAQHAVLLAAQLRAAVLVARTRASEQAREQAREARAAAPFVLERGRDVHAYVHGVTPDTEAACRALARRDLPGATIHLVERIDHGKWHLCYDL